MSHKTYRKETNCLNCGAEVTGKFCSNCGQENLETRENFFHVAGHFISDIFHFDSKFFSSLIPLFTKPGFLTREYWDGRRMRYIHPLRLFFFSAIIFALASVVFFNRFGEEMKFKSFAYTVDPAFVTIDSTYLSTLNDSVKLYVGGGYDSMTVKDIKYEKYRPARMLNKINSGTDLVFKSIKYVTFLLLPIYALLFKVLYRKKKPFFVDHLVYAMHLQCFIYVTLAVIFLIPLVFPLSLSVIARISVIALFVYTGLSLNYLYHQPWWKTLIKTVVATCMLFFITNITVILIALFDAVFIQ